MQIAQSGAIVGGGASGLGAATARRLHAHGAHVVIADQNVERGSILADELGERATFVAADVTDPDAVQAAVDVARAQPGPAADRRLVRRDRGGRPDRGQQRAALVRSL